MNWICALHHIHLEKEVDEVDRKDEEQQKYKRIKKVIEGHDFGCKIPSKNIIKRNAYGSATAPSTCVRNNNGYSIFEDSEEGTEEEDWKCIKTDKPSDEMKTKINFDAENLSADDIEEIICKYDKNHLEGSPAAGAFKYVSMLETKITEKKKK